MRKLFYLFGLVSMGMIAMTSCGDDTTMTDEVKSRFTANQDANDPFTWTFSNQSVNAVSYEWSFGEDNASSTAESPTFTYATEGEKVVTLTATGADGSEDVSTRTIDVVDPNVELKKLTGDDSKTWKLNRDLTNLAYPAEVGPSARDQIWWAYGLNEPIGTRTCFMEEEYIFSFDGTYEYRPQNDMVFAESGIWDPDVEGVCVDATVADNMLNVDGTNISAWGAGTHTFDFDVQGGELTLIGTGAHVGLAKVGTDKEYNTPQSSVTYKVISLETDGPVDLMILETDLTDDAGAVFGYWRFALVAYDPGVEEPELPGAPPTAGFNYEISGSTVTFTNTSVDATSYSWDFGDGNNSTEENPVHTYEADATYTVVLTATNDNGSDMSTQSVTISNVPFTADVLHGGGSKTWKLAPQAAALWVGPCPGDGTCDQWWANAIEDVAARDCLFDDTWTFDNAGNMTYATQGMVWGESYMGVMPDGCVETSSLTGGAEAWGDGTHTYTATDAGASDGTISVTGTGAFIGLGKAYNGGEYSSPPPTTDGTVNYTVLSYVSGTTETMQVMVDILPPGYWIFTLVTE
jgi:PKD repeat protein